MYAVPRAARASCRRTTWFTEYFNPFRRHPCPHRHWIKAFPMYWCSASSFHPQGTVHSPKLEARTGCYTTGMLRISDPHAPVTTPLCSPSAQALAQLRLWSAQVFTRRYVAKTNLARNYQLLTRGSKRSLRENMLPLYHANRYGDHNLGGYFLPCSKSGRLLSTLSSIALSVRLGKCSSSACFYTYLVSSLCSR